MKVYVGTKFYPDHSNKEFVEELCSELNKKDFQTFCVAKDLECWGKYSFPASLLMDKTFEAINSCDIVLIDLSEKGVGLGIEAGYAHARGKKIVTVLRRGADLSNTLKGISSEVIEFETANDLAIKFVQSLPSLRSRAKTKRFYSYEHEDKALALIDILGFGKEVGDALRSRIEREGKVVYESGSK